MNKTIGILLILIVLGGFSYMVMQKKEPAVTQGAIETITETPVVSSETVVNDSVITVEGSPFQFVPNQIRVKKGVATTILFKNMEGMHDFVVDELAVRTKVLKSGEEESVNFTASATGSYEFYCSVGTHRAMGMKGTLIVEE